MYDIDDLIDGAKDYLVKEGHSRSSIAHHEAEWKRLKAWFVATGLEAYDHDVETRYFVEAGFLGGRLTKQRQTERGHVERLLSIAETGGLPDREAKTRYSVPPGFAGAYRAYADELECVQAAPIEPCCPFCMERCSLLRGMVFTLPRNNHPSCPYRLNMREYSVQTDFRR